MGGGFSETGKLIPAAVRAAKADVFSEVCWFATVWLEPATLNGAAALAGSVCAIKDDAENPTGFVAGTRSGGVGVGDETFSVKFVGFT